VKGEFNKDTETLKTNKQTNKQKNKPLKLWKEKPLQHTRTRG
jgi:hypothetical protein